MEPNMEMMEIEILEIASKYPDGVSDQDLLKLISGTNLNTLAMAVNNLLKKNYLQVYIHGDSYVYKKVSQTEISILSDLKTEEKLIYQQIKNAGSKGIWIKDLKIKTALHQLVISKILKSLESKRIVKSVRSVKNTTKKLYMLVDVNPSIEITGGPWFTDGELDVEFITGLTKAIYSVIKKKQQIYDITHVRDVDNLIKGVNIQELFDFISNCDLSRIPLSQKDIQSVVDVLVYDGLVTYYIDKDKQVFYYTKAVQSIPSPLQNIPVTTCLDSHKCYLASFAGRCLEMDKVFQAN